MGEVNVASHECCGCPEYNAVSRRRFLAGAGAAAAAAAIPAWLPKVAFAQEFCSNRDVIVAIFLRGAADGLTLCVPHQEAAYYTNRPTLAIPPPDSGGPHRAIDLDGFFGFPPALASLLPAYQAGHLLVVHAAGSLHETRSHFDGQLYMDAGVPGSTSVVTGWLGRHLATTGPMQPGAALRGVALGYNIPQLLAGAPGVLAIPDLDAFGYTGAEYTRAERRETIAALYAQAREELRETMETTNRTIDLLDQINFAGYQPAGSAVYPSSELGLSLRSAAALIRADVGVETVAIDVGGWDTHAYQGATQGYLANLLSGFGAALAAFHADVIAGAERNVTLVVISEFGRELTENASFGTDHGHGNVLFAMGRHIAGGRVFARWPGLEPEQLHEGRDLQVTTDYRDVLAEILVYRAGARNLAALFPGHQPAFIGATTDCLAGDTDCDGWVGYFDIDPFVQAIADPVGYQLSRPSCNINSADLNRDGVADYFDIDTFLRKLQP